MNGCVIAGIGTEIGKTLVSAVIVEALSADYWKPIQSGGLEHTDTDAVKALVGPHERVFHPEAYRLRVPASPHAAAAAQGVVIEADRLTLPKTERFLVVELAGGLMVPLNDDTLTIDMVQRWGLPVVLVASYYLGSINHSLLSIEALRRRNIAVSGLVFNGDPVPETRAIILSYSGLDSLLDIPYTDSVSPSFVAARAREFPTKALTMTSKAIRGRAHGSFAITGRRALCADDLHFDRNHLWHPYTSMTAPLPVYPVASASGVRLRLTGGEELIDGMSSWWTAIHGYNHPKLNAALNAQMQDMSHVMFGGITHKPAIDLGRKLLALTPQGLEQVFFADCGSVAVEVAIKMAAQYWQAQGLAAKTKLLTIRGGYHGDTFQAMSVCDPVTGMHELFRGVLPTHFFADRPRVQFHQPWDAADLRSFETLIAANHASIAAVILEPIVQGAGGMRFYHPDYLRGVRKLCDRHRVLLIADEIATGFGRSGALFACDHAGITPDILCLGKALTGGTMTLAATLATRQVAHGISQGEANGGLFMHGPTFMANPLACAAANASIDLLLSSDWQQRVQTLQHELTLGLAPCKDIAAVAEVRVLGAIGVVEMNDPVDVAALQRQFVKRGVWIRPFAKLVYVMPPYIMEEDDIRALTRAMVEVLRGV